MKHYHALFIALAVSGGCTAEPAGPEDLRDLEVDATGTVDLIDDLDELDEDTPEAPMEAADELSDETRAVAGDFNLQAHLQGGGDWALISWETPQHYNHTICWKEADEPGRPCTHNQVPIHSSDPNYLPDTETRLWGFYDLECDTEYMLRVKRSLLNYDTITFSTPECTCEPEEHCPYGGWFDGANCSFGEAPAGTTAFVYAGSYYHTPRPSWPFCPISGSTFDTVNCRVRPVPAGANPFINANHWYYSSECE
ncbi:MAG: hypothetical protein AAF799_24435 [Myxococcota bacterium]